MIDGIGMVKCVESIKGDHCVELIFFAQGKRLVFDKVGRPGKKICSKHRTVKVTCRWNKKAQTILKGAIFKQKDSNCRSPNSVIVRVLQYE